MTTVITYGTYDVIHYGHIRLLERAKELGDYLIVGVTADDFDKTRGKINVQQSLMERIENVRATGLADKIIVEEYEGQKIDDIHRYNVDIFTVGSDWKGHFDYLKEYCKVVYLDRTQGISSTEIRSENSSLKLGLVGEISIVDKFYKESQYVNGLEIAGICTQNESIFEKYNDIIFVTTDYSTLLEKCDAVYIVSHPTKHYEQIKEALNKNIHVLCESPLALTEKECRELFSIADEKNLTLMDSIKTAYATAYARLLLILKGGAIGKILSIDATCTSLADLDDEKVMKNKWNSITDWGPTALLPVFQILGTKWKDVKISSLMLDKFNDFDLFSRISFDYENAIATLKVGVGVKSEGELIISGTQGYIYVPAPWWKTDYFEIRYEDQSKNRRYFYQLDGEGIRYELVAFLKSIKQQNTYKYISEDISFNISRIMEEFSENKSIICNG